MSFNVHWLLDRDYLDICYGSLDNEMTQALTALGVPFQIVHWRSRVFTEGFVPSSDENVVYGVVGSVAFCRDIAKIIPLTNVYLLFPDEVKAYSTYAYMVDHELRLNKSGFMLSLGEMKNQGVSNLRQLSHCADGVFLKCDFGLKSAESEFIPWDKFDAWLGYTVEHTGCSLKSNFWLFPRQEINKEFRFAVVDGVIVTGCQYMDFSVGLDVNTPTLSKDVPNGALVAANEIVKELSIGDDSYVLDIAETSLGYYMVECNAISSSGWYMMDHKSLFESLGSKVSEMAEEFVL